MLLATATTLLLALAARPTPPPRSIGSAKQLFLDDVLVASASNVSVRLHRPTTLGGNRPSVLPDQPWECKVSAFSSLVDNGTHTLLYYDNNNCNDGFVPGNDTQRRSSLAVSTDGGLSCMLPDTR